MLNDAERLVEAWAGFLGDYAWNHGAHLTTRFPLSDVAIYSELRNGFIRRLARMTGRSVAWFAAKESTYEDRPHLHVLLGATASLTTKQLAWAWKAGHSRITLLHTQKQAIRYVVKEVGRYPDNYGLSRIWIPRSHPDIGPGEC